MAYLYVLARLLPLSWALATLSGLVPRAVALSLALALTQVLVPFAGEPRGELMLGLLRELCVGGVFALALSLALAALPWAVRWAQPSGSLASVSPLATAYGLCAAWLVLSLGGVRALLRGLIESFGVLPIGGALDHRAFVWGVVKLVSAALAGALGIALPFAVAAVALEVSSVLVLRTRELGPVLFLGLAMLLLVPVVIKAPELWRFLLEAAQALTRTLAK
jgi:flagellar biosynthesis protein FliR